MSAGFRDNWYALAPPWLRTGVAEKYLYTLQLCSDVLIDRANQAAKIRMPGEGDPSQLPWLANDRVLVQGPAEPNASFVTRLRNWRQTWKRAGSRVAILANIQAYLQGLQPGVSAARPLLTIVSGNVVTTSWSTLYNGDAIGAAPTLATVAANWNWDGVYKPWRSWLILYMALVATGQSGAAGATGAASGPTLGTGTNTAGVWVPNASATGGVGFLALSGLAGLTAANVGQWIKISGSANGQNNGTFPIVAVGSASTCTIANPNGVGSDAGPLTWTISAYPFIGPAPVWGAPGTTFGQGELAAPPKDHGVLVGGIWEPSPETAGYSPSASWGLTCSADTISSIRSLLRTWRSANTYYPAIIVAFDGGTGVAGNVYSPNSTPTTGNPNGTFGGHGQNVAGVWVPNRGSTNVVSGARPNFDAFCQGTGSWPCGAAEVS